MTMNKMNKKSNDGAYRARFADIIHAVVGKVQPQVALL